MKCRQNSYLDSQLKNYNKNTTWNEQHQQKIQKDILHSIEKQASKCYKLSKKRMHKLFAGTLTILLLIGICITGWLYMEEETMINKDQYNSAQPNIPSDNEFEEPKIDKQLKTKISTIEKSGFMVGIPKRVPETANVMLNISNKELRNGVHLVKANYGQIQDIESGKWSLQIIQEKLMKGDNKDDAIQHVKKVIGKDKKLEELMVKGNIAFLYNPPLNKKELNSMWIITEKYFYTVTSPNLSKEKLLELLNSVTYY